MDMKEGSSGHENRLLHATRQAFVIIVIGLRAANYIKLVAEGHVSFKLDYRNM
jgi:hypothetical protein